MQTHTSATDRRIDTDHDTAATGFTHDVGRHRVEVVEIDDGIVTEIYLRCRRCGKTAREADEFRERRCTRALADGGRAPLDTPDGWEDWPFEAKRAGLAGQNTALELRQHINDRVGLSCEDMDADQAGRMTKEELAAVFMALGGPEATE